MLINRWTHDGRTVSTKRFYDVARGTRT